MGKACRHKSPDGFSTSAQGKSKMFMVAVEQFPKAVSTETNSVLLPDIQGYAWSLGAMVVSLSGIYTMSVTRTCMLQERVGSTIKNK